MQYLPKIGEWRRRDIQLCQLKDYDLTYAFYSKFPSWGCQEELCAFTAKIHPTPHPHLPLRLKSSPLDHHKTSSDTVFPPSLSDASSDPHSSILLLWSAYQHYSAALAKLTYYSINFDDGQFKESVFSKRLPETKKNFDDFRTSPLSIHVYISFTLFILVFSFNDFSSPPLLFSWWRNKISWGLLKNF